MPKFDHALIEKAAQEKWEAAKVFETDLTRTDKDPYYLLFEFPYPSGDLHIGHRYAFALTDIYARMQRAKGKNVLFPMGFDAFGLPAENAAIKRGVDPREWTLANIEHMRSQVRLMGTSVDWSKEVIACDPSYYKWTQWLFQKFYEHDLAERKEAAVKWCPQDQTVLANEQVVDGTCERCGTEVEEKRLTQWFLKITTYAERLLNDLETLSWPEEIKEAQRQWIGKSEGAKISFKVAGGSEQEIQKIEVFTTRADTLYGVTYVVVAPESEYAASLIPLAKNKDAALAYVLATTKKTERERSENKEKTGVCLEGITVTNPANNESIPVYVADYVLGTYGTGAVMAVPAHDERDYAFAKKYQLPIRQVVAPRAIDHTNPPQEGKNVVTRNGILAVVRNPKDDTYLCLKWKHAAWTTSITGGLDEGEEVVEAAKREILEETGYKNLKLINTFGISVAEFFASHKDENRIAKGTLLYFELENGEQDEVSEGERAKHEVVWLSKKEVEGAGMQHAEFALLWNYVHNGYTAYTGDGMLVSSGPFDGRNNREALSDIVEATGGERTTNFRIRDWLVSRQRYWGCPIPIVYDPLGAPHSIPEEHLPWLLPTDVDFTPTGKAPLASSKELKQRVIDIFGEGWTPEYDTLDTFVDSSWYFTRYLDAHDSDNFSDIELIKKWMPVQRYSGGSEHTTMHLLYARFFYKALYDLALVPTPEPFMERFNRGLIMGPDGQKMSKSKGNVVNPDEVVAEFGADAVRAYLAFIGPYNEPGHYPWKPEGVRGMRKFLDRVYALSEKLSEEEPHEDVRRAVSVAIQKVSDDGERFKFNTALSALMVLINAFETLPSVPRAAYRAFLVLLAPFAPHLAEHLYEKVGGEGLLVEAAWPAVDPALLEKREHTVTVQLNGKRKGEVLLSPDASEEEARSAALALASMSGIVPERVIYVPGRIINLVRKAE